MAGKRENERKLLWQAWEKLRDASNTEPSQEEIMSSLKRAACKELARDMARFRSYAEREDGLYEQLKSLMDVYRNVVASKEGMEEYSQETKDILLVFEARLIKFEKDGSQFVSSGKNPINIEKNEIMEGALIYLADKIDKEFSSGIITPGTIKKLYKYYKGCFGIVYLSLGDIRVRKAARFYLHAFEQELAFLEELSKNSLPGLEDLQPENSEEAELLAKIIKALQETPVTMVGFQNDFQTPEPPIEDCQGFAEFEKVMAEAEDALAITNKDALGSEEEKAFNEALGSEAKVFFDELRHSFLKGGYKLRQVIASDILLTNEITEAFSQTLAEIPELTPDGDALETERQIVSGIAETIEIKIESLKDSLVEFRETSDALIASFSNESDLFTETMQEEVHEALIDGWKSSPPEEALVDGFFEAAKEWEALAKCKDIVEKKLLSFIGNAEKKSFKFKREVLLFEVCTYEEILTHSVSRLRDSNSEAVISAAKIFDNAFGKLEVILRKNNIKILRPLPHDQFNAKEHEVLVAEKQEGFAKGEIIKIVNAGFMYDGKIIIRANVIAAK